MVLGFCNECLALKPIQPASLKLGSRECEWRPFPHTKLVHLECRALVVVGVYTCTSCGLVEAGHECKRVLNGTAEVHCDDDAYLCKCCGVIPAFESTTTRCRGDEQDIR